ncbi:MAG: phosphotransferase [Deltaproteobacteria bacterium]|nr:phosphotransferase [Deltaproteobacteria bacterium]
MSLPSNPAELTLEWLSETLGTPVASVEVLDHACATNQRARISLTYERPGAGPDSLFVKLAPLDESHRQMIGAIGMGVREVQFYADVSGAIDLLVPRCAYACAEGDLFVLLLEDLASRGCLFSNGEWGVSANAAASALEDLARFHARFENPAARDAVAPWLRAPDRGPGSDATAGLMRWVLDENAETLSPDYSAIGEHYVEHHAWFDEVWHAGPQTYIHGDLHIGNVFLDSGRVGFIDWGLSRTSTHLRDVSYFLTMSVDVEERRANERALLQTYLDALRHADGIAIPFDEAWQAYRLQASYTVIATFLAYMPSYATGDGVALGNDLLNRANAALEDLDVVDAVRAALPS